VVGSLKKCDDGNFYMKVGPRDGTASYKPGENVKKLGLMIWHAFDDCAQDMLKKGDRIDFEMTFTRTEEKDKL